MSLTVGTTFAGYTILGMLGSGGMAEVYLAQHPRLPRRDALKVMSNAITADTDFRERFQREADLAATLWHPNIVQVHDRGVFEGHLWMSMEYVEGTDAAQLVKDRYPAGMPTQDVCTIVSAVADALDHAHQRGLLHRDVKPANILLTEPEDGKRRIMLADFGIARPLGDISGLTATNFTVGTLAYAAPEQLMGADIDGRADQYALAATAFHLLTGSQPYPHCNPAVVISRHLNAAPPRLADSRENLAVFDPALAVALSKSPSARYARCSDFARALIEQNTSTAAAASAAAPTHAAPVAPRPGTEVGDSQSRAMPAAALRHPLLAAGAATLAVIGVVVATVWQPWSRHAPTSSPTATVSTAPPGSSALAPPAASVTPSTSPTSVPLGGGGIFPASAMDTVLLTPAEINTLVAGASSGPFLQVKESTFGMLNNAKLVEPPSCVGVIFTGDHVVFDNTGFISMHDEILESSGYSSAPGLTHVEQTVVVYPTARQAQAVLASSQRQWKSCATGQVHLGTVGQNGENGKAFELGNVQLTHGVLSVPMIANSQESGGGACQQAMAVRANVVVGARSCRDPEPPPGQLDAPVSSVRNDAVSLANAMTDKVTA